MACDAALPCFTPFARLRRGAAVCCQLRSWAVCCHRSLMEFALLCACQGLADLAKLRVETAAEVESGFGPSLPPLPATIARLVTSYLL